MTARTARERRLLAIAILVAGIALVWAGVIAPIARGFADRAARRDLLLATYARDERIIGQLASIARAAALQRRERAGFRLDTSDPAAATTLLTERLAAAIAGTGGAVVGIEPVAAPSGAVRARLQARVTLAQAIALVERLETGAPLLTMDALGIDAKTDDAPRNDLLDLRIEVSAFLASSQPR